MTTAQAGASFGIGYHGGRLLEDGRALSQAIDNGDWLEGGLAFLNMLGDAAAALADPIATLTSLGLGWVMEHLKPLSTWLEQLAGSESNVAGVARQWTSTGSSLRDTGATLTSRLRDLDGMSGATVASYVRFANDTARHLSASGEWAQAAAGGLTSASMLVSKMQGVVKSAISQVVSTAIEAMAVVAASFGLGIGYAVARVVMKVNQMVNKVVRPLTQVVQSVKTLTGLVQRLRTLFDGTADKMTTALSASTQRVVIDAGTVTDAGAATRFGNTAEARLLLAGRIADATDHTNTPVVDIPRTSTADFTPTADGSVAGTTMLGGGGSSGTSIGLSSTSSAAGGGVTGSAITGGAGLAAGAVVARTGGMAPTGGRMPMAPMNSAGAADSRETRASRRRRLAVVIEPRADGG